ncbi:hypothetical protein HQ571_06825 [Candidatus Kuenenbacteria bacterium]|nr:hypothetical protein [Candidatus Kuenenbacteria bacterium]
MAPLTVCWKCFSEYKGTEKCCPNCGETNKGGGEKTRPDFPFGMRLGKNEPAMWCTNLQAGDMIIYVWDDKECLQFFRGKQRIWLFKSGHWVKSILSNRFGQYDPGLKGNLKFAVQGFVPVLAAVLGLRAIKRPTKKGRDRWVLK